MVPSTYSFFLTILLKLVLKPFSAFRLKKKNKITGAIVCCYVIKIENHIKLKVTRNNHYEKYGIYSARHFDMPILDKI